MEHPTDREILDALAGQPEALSILQDHLAACESCRNRMQEFQRTWDVLGEWTVEAPDIDLTADILKQAGKVRSIYLWQPGTLLRIAASIIVGIGAGSLTALSMRAEISSEQVSEAMHLDVLAVNSSTGWTGPLLGSDLEN